MEPTVPAIESKLDEISLAAQSRVAGLAICACGSPLAWKRVGICWEGKCDRGHEMGGRIVQN